MYNDKMRTDCTHRSEEGWTKPKGSRSATDEFVVALSAEIELDEEKEDVAEDVDRCPDA